MSKQASKTFQQIWRQMDHGRRRQAAEAFTAGSEYAGEQRRAAGVIAVKLNLRPQKAAKLPPEKTATYLTTIETLDEQLASILVRAYLFTHQQPMLTMFLDELHIPHEQGAISNDPVTPPDSDSLKLAVERIRAAFPQDDVRLYLSALSVSDSITWANLDAATSDRPGVNP